MRCSHFSILAVLLVTATIAFAQYLTVQVTPLINPTEIPPEGGSFNYQVSVTNHESTPQQCTLWCVITAPDGEQRVTLQPWTAGITAGQTIQRSFMQTAPAASPMGNYVLTANIGIYPNTIWDSDQLVFCKLKPPEWVARYNGPGNIYDYATSLAVDGSGNVYVTGYSHGSGTDDDYATIKYNSAGFQEWVARYNGPSNGDDYATSLAVDGSGNIYITGYSYGSGTNRDYATIKYNSSGVQEWVARYNGPDNDGDRANSLAVDGSGNVYVTGWSDGGGTGYDYATIKYNSTGVQQWVARYNGPGNDYDEATSLAVDGSGNVYVTGYSPGSGETNEDYASIKYNSAGVQEWVARYQGSGNGDDYATSLEVDGNGNAYVTGYSRGIGTGSDYATIKYSATDLPNWQQPVATAFGAPLPSEYRLEQNFPNPFNPTTIICFDLPANSLVTLEVFDVSGRLVTTLINGWREAGSHEVTFDGSELVSGVYLYRLSASGSGATPTMLTGKMVLLK